MWRTSSLASLLLWNPSTWCWEEATSRNCKSSLQVAERATTPMPSREDFACGRKRGGAVPPLPARIVYERRKATARNVCTDPDDLSDVGPRRHAGAPQL